MAAAAIVAWAESLNSGPIDIVVPVYNAADDLRRCVESVLAHASGDYRLLLIDDASSDPAIAAYLAELQARSLPQLTVLTNSANAGFTLTANRGMQAARPRADVVLLNSDTLVTRGWLDAMSRCARSDPAIGTITPFSNNAEICSLPRFCENNPWPPDRDPEPLLRALAQAAVPVYPDLPTGVGFCMYIRRPLLDAIGGFDPVFGMGYGEENDFCMRAAAAGYRNVLCEDSFVAHMGSSSFGARRAELVRRNLEILQQRHPTYESLVREFIAADPLRALRELALSQLRVLDSRLPGLLHVIHGHGGGSEYYVRALVAASQGTFRHYLLTVSGDFCHIEEPGDGTARRMDFRRLAGEAWVEFFGGIAARFGIALVHLHNVPGGHDDFAETLPELGLPYGYTVHDLHLACPTNALLDANKAYCGGQTDLDACSACLAAQPAFARIDIRRWRSDHGALLAGAAFVIAPSQWAAATLRRYFPQRQVSVIAHAGLGGTARADAIAALLPMPDDGRPVVAVLGAIGPDKGARRLERLVEMTRARNLHLRWVLIGYHDRDRAPFQSADGTFTMHGPYDSRALPGLLDHYRVDLVAFPSVCPETYSFTLSESWASGRPVLVPPIGALADRVNAAGAGWVLGDDWQSDEHLLERIVALLVPVDRAALAAVAARARAAVLPTLAQMVEQTVAIYRDAIRGGTRGAAREPIAARRCLEALHYVAWRPAVAPPTPSPDETPAAVPVAPRVPGDAITQMARAALQIRHTLPGRVLYRLAPKALLDALKGRLGS